MIVTNDELFEVIGGATSYTSSSFLNAASRFVTTLLTLGQTVGSCIRRMYDKATC